MSNRNTQYRIVGGELPVGETENQLAQEVIDMINNNERITIIDIIKYINDRNRQPSGGGYYRIE